MMMDLVALLLLALLAIGRTDALRFAQRSSWSSREGLVRPLRMVDSDAVYDEAVKSAPAGEERSRIEVVVKGDLVASAIFRAEVKKELSFYRGCNGSYTSRNKNHAKIVGEGKHQQVLRFLEWLHLMTLPQIKRKPNFQGPSLVVELESAAWQPPSGLKGFIFEANLPSLNEELDRDNEKVKNMAGTDESV